MYEDGEGVEKNEKIAMEWLEKSAKQGNNKANMRLLRKNLMKSQRTLIFFDNFLPSNCNCNDMDDEDGDLQN